MTIPHLLYVAAFLLLVKAVIFPKSKPMGYYSCELCGTSGHMRQPKSKWWQFWKRQKCTHCMGTGREPPPWMSGKILVSPPPPKRK